MKNLKKMFLGLLLLTGMAASALSKEPEADNTNNAKNSIKSIEPGLTIAEREAKALFELLVTDQQLIANQLREASEKKDAKVKKACSQKKLFLPIGPVEALANRLRVSPTQIRLQYHYYSNGLCFGKIYTPKGACQVYFTFGKSSIIPRTFNYHACL